MRKKGDSAKPKHARPVPPVNPETAAAAAAEQPPVEKSIQNEVQEMLDRVHLPVAGPVVAVAQPVSLADEVASHIRECPLEQPAEGSTEGNAEEEPPAKTPAKRPLDPEVAAYRAQGIGAEEGPKAPPRPMDAEVAALHAADKARREAFRAQVEDVPRTKDGKRIARVGEPRRAAIKTGRKYTPIDRTRIDPKLIPEGCIGEWVSAEDSLGHGTRSWHRFEEERSWGAEVIRTKDGKPLVGPLGIAMAMPAEKYVAKAHAHAPLGAMNPEDLLEPARELSRESGYRVGFRKLREHGTRRVHEAFDADDLQGLADD